MSLRLTSRALVALSTHARNVGKAAEVLGALKAKPTAGDIDVAVEHKDGARFLTFKANGNGSTMNLPLMGVDAVGVDAGVLSLLVGLESVAKAGNPAQVDNAMVAALRDRADAAEAITARTLKSHSETVTARDALKRTVANLTDERDQLLATVQELTTALGKAKAAPAAPIKARLDAAKADHGSLLDAIVAETASAKAKPAAPQVAQVQQQPKAAPVAVAAAAAVETLQELEGRADVELESVANRVVRVVFLPVGGLRGRQGLGIADALKARGFRYDGKASVNGRLVWVR